APYGDSGGPLDGCQGATAAVGGKLFEVSRYINFFTKEVKANPRQVILASIAAPPTPFATLVANPGTLAPCAPGQAIDGIKCAVVLGHTCKEAPYSDPAVRIDQVVRSAPRFVQGTICGLDFTATLQSLANSLLTLRMGG